MYCLTVSYPKLEGKKFDEGYYENTHLLLVKNKMSEYGLESIVLRKHCGSKPEAGEAYFASVDLVFDSVINMSRALAAVGTDINADIANFTNTKIEYQFSEVRIL